MSGSVMLPAPVTWLTKAGTPRDEWLAARRSGVGGSDVAAVLGTSPWTTGHELWLDKTGRIPHRDAPEAAHWGGLLEDTVAREWARRAGATVRRTGMCADPDRPWRLASVDRVIVEPGTRRAVSILEVKTTSARSGGLSDADITDRYSTQVRWYLGITGLPYADVAVLVGGQELRTVRIHADDVWYQRVGKAVDGWWQRHVVADEPPALQAADNGSLGSIPADPEALAVIADTRLAEDVARLHQVRNRLAVDTEEKDWLEARIKAALGEATELLTADGRTLATWRDNTSTRLDTSRLKTAEPDVYAKYTTSSSSRRFILKEDDE